MLIRFSVANFRSFSEEAVFSMVPGRSRQHADHILKASRPDGIDLLRMGLLYGANASGKSNLVKAMAFARELIVDDKKAEQPILVQPFRLDSIYQTRPSFFQFEFIVEGTYYVYGLELTPTEIKEEWLQTVKNDTEQTLFDRKTIDGKAIVDFPDLFIEDEDEEERLYLRFVARSCNPNQTFLHAAIRNNLDTFGQPFHWFKNKLKIISPVRSYNNLLEILHDNEQAIDYIQRHILTTSNTGIGRISVLKVLENENPFELTSEEIEAVASFPSDIGFVQEFTLNNRSYALRRSREDHNIYMLGTARRTSDGKETWFHFSDESDGTQRLIELAALIFSDEDQVIVIDELERSLHPNLVRQFLMLLAEQDNRNQLIVTTHESTLLDLDLLRRDEIWFVEKSPAGASTVYSLEEFKPRHDLDIRKGYLQGRFGAIPVFGNALQADEEDARCHENAVP